MPRKTVKRCRVTFVGRLGDRALTAETMLDFLGSLHGTAASGASALANDGVVGAACTRRGFYGVSGAAIPDAFSV